MKRIMLIYSPVDTYSGYGSCGRTLCKSLIELYKEEYEIKIVSCGWGSLPENFISENNKEWGFLQEYFINENLNKQTDVYIHHGVPSEAQPIGKYNILVCAGIETTICSPQWIESINKMDLVIVPSKHSKDVFLNSQFNKQHAQTGEIVGTIKCEVPIEIIHEGFLPEIFNHILKPIESDINTTLNNIKEDFCFLFVGSFLPGVFLQDRKNVSGLIKIFLETFKNKKNKPALILKTHISSCSIPQKEELLSKIDQIRKSCGTDNLPNIYLLYGELTDEEMNQLYNHKKVKAMVSLTRGEGYSRTFVEFSQSKKPLIVSGWSGHLDFCKPDCTTLIPGEITPIHPSAQVENMLIDGSGWFLCNLGHVKSVLEDYFENYKKYQELGNKFAHHCKQNFDYDKMKELIKDKFKEYIKLVPILKMPTLKKL